MSTTDRPARVRSLFLAAVTAFGAFAVLCGLGLWQVERKAWKEDLIATLQQRISAPPGTLPSPADWQKLAPEQWEFRRVTVQLEFLDASPAYVYSGGSALRADVKSPGYFVFVPARLANGEILVVDVGYVPDRQYRASGGRREITGYLRWPERSNWFVSDHDAAGDTWFVRDPQAMAQVKQWGAAAPFYIDQESPTPPGGLPRPAAITVHLPNNHLGYALTWFGLAAGLAGVFGFWARKQLRERHNPDAKTVSL